MYRPSGFPTSLPCVRVLRSAHPLLLPPAQARADKRGTTDAARPFVLTLRVIIVCFVCACRRVRDAVPRPDRVRPCHEALCTRAGASWCCDLCAPLLGEPTCSFSVSVFCLSVLHPRPRLCEPVALFLVHVPRHITHAAAHMAVVVQMHAMACGCSPCVHGSFCTVVSVPQLYTCPTEYIGSTECATECILNGTYCAVRFALLYCCVYRCGASVLRGSTIHLCPLQHEPVLYRVHQLPMSSSFLIPITSITDPHPQLPASALYRVA